MESGDLSKLEALYRHLEASYLADESACIRKLSESLPHNDYARYRPLAEQLVQTSQARSSSNHLQAFLSEFSLSSKEGEALMSLAEALLRIPDTDTQNRLIASILAGKDWSKHLGHSASGVVNASAWGLLISGRVLHSRDYADEPGLSHLVQRLGAPLVRLALERAIALLGSYFIAAESLPEGLAWAHQQGLVCSFDMLGEGAITADDARRYLERYQNALDQLAEHKPPAVTPHSLSIKLSALHPRYEWSQRQRVLRELSPVLLRLARQAREKRISLTIDAEEAHRLGLSLELFEAVFSQPDLQQWNGFGLAVQAYQKRALPELEWLHELAQKHQKTIPLRLVKGAYWDTEIKRAQRMGLAGYPVFTQKWATDISYLACTQYLLQHPESFNAQLATHNALTLAAVDDLAQHAAPTVQFEYQRLHGMGQAIHQAAEQHFKTQHPCRVYAPIGQQHELLPYLIRRMLENGANTSFVHQLGQASVDLKVLLQEPLALARQNEFKPHPNIPGPDALYAPRINSSGINTDNERDWKRLWKAAEPSRQSTYQASPLVSGHTTKKDKPYSVVNPANAEDVVGHCQAADHELARDAISAAHQAWSAWSRKPVEERAACLERAADELQARSVELSQLCVREGGRCIADALDEVREAIDFCRYYAIQARHMMKAAAPLPGITGETNTIRWCGRGVFVCISPWNFPLAIFTGQIAAALVTGNSVIAKPASATPLIAMQVVQLFHRAGIPENVLHYLPGSAETIEQALLTDPRVAGVACTGALQTAQQINRILAARNSPIASLIAETGGINAMIVDNSALAEQWVPDAIRSAFNSAGQRCSALRLLFLPESTADTNLQRLIGALQEWTLGDPASPASDIGPLISAEARSRIEDYVDHLKQQGKLLYQGKVPAQHSGGHFFPPTVCRLDDPSELKQEVFGPVLHVVRYREQNIDDVIEAINQTGYGLTLGVHSRIQTTIDAIQQRVRVGNLYINRDIIGAVVESQPFGGIGLSGTGTKAGGESYLTRFAYPITLTNNDAAVGGDTQLIGSTEGQQKQDKPL